MYGCFPFREIDKLQEELVDSESILDSKRKVPYILLRPNANMAAVYFRLPEE